MRALICQEYGGPEGLRVADAPEPAAGPGEVLIRVEAAGVSFVDTLIIQNLHQRKHPLPFSPGRELAGTVVSVGEDVTTLKPGDAVAALVDNGAHAELAVAVASEVFPRPEDCSALDAGGHLSVYLTSWLALKERAQLRAGQRVLVLGAGGGTGQAAVDCASALGAEVMAAASSTAKLDAARQRGAAHTVNYRDASLDEAVKNVWPEGADVVFDPVAGDLFDAASRCVGWNGSYLIIGFAGGAVPQFAANRLLIKNRAALGFVLMYYRTQRQDLLAQAARDVLGGFAAGTLAPFTAEVGGLEDAPRMMRDIMDRKAVGKSAVTLE